MTVVSLRDYAESQHVSYEAIRRQVVRYKEELGEHIIVDGRQQFLDEFAVAFLDEHRKKNPIVIYQQSKDETIKALQEENRELHARLAAQAEQIVELTSFRIEAIEQRQLLEAAKIQQAERSQALDRRERELDNEIQAARDEAYVDAEQKCNQAAAQAIREAQEEAATVKAAKKEVEDKLHLQEQSEAGKDRRIAELESLSPWEAFWIQFRKWVRGELR